MGSSNDKEAVNQEQAVAESNRMQRSATVELNDRPAPQTVLLTESNAHDQSRSNRHTKIKKTRGLPSQKEFKTVETTDDAVPVVANCPPRKNV